MAEDKAGKKEGEEGEAPAAPAAKKNKLPLMIGAGVAVLLLAIGVPVTLVMMKKPAETHSEIVGADAASNSMHPEMESSLEEDEADEGEEVLGAIYPFETFVVNLSGGKYLRTQIQLEFAGREVTKRFYAKLIPIRDEMLTLLAAKDADDISTGKGKEELKQQVKELINESLRKEDIKKVYITQFVIQ